MFRTLRQHIGTLTMRLLLTGAVGLLGTHEASVAHEIEAVTKRGDEAYRNDAFDKAIADYTEAIRLDPNYVKAYHLRGLIYRMKGEQAKAEADLARAKELGYRP